MKWKIDPAHTSVEFAVRFMGLTSVRGRFKRVTGTLETADNDGCLKMIEAIVDATSIDTGEPHRDVHLLSPDFLDAARHPTMTFTSRRIEEVADGRYRVLGDLTIRGETRPVEFQVETTAPRPDRRGWRAGATATGTLLRKEWGVSWNQVLLLGLLVADGVQFTLDVHALSAPEPVPALDPLTQTG
jgi:polyisoprenoid-binding protein YceI